MDASFEPTLNILSAYPMMIRKYGVKMQEDDFLEEALLAFKEINSIPVKKYYYIEKLSPTLRIQVPCNLHKIISVTASPMNVEDYASLEPYKKRNQESDTEFKNVVYSNSDMKTYHFNDDKFTGVGSYINYQWEDSETILIDDTRLEGLEISIVYEGMVTDNDGLPMITRKHAQAIAAKLALSYMTRKMFEGEQGAMNVLPFIQQEASRLVQAAAIPEAITDNDLDRLLDVQTSWDRKRYNRPFKFRRS